MVGDVVHIDTTSLVSFPSSNAPAVDLATKRYFLAALLEMITGLCECCGSFMRNRFKNDVWPKIASLLGIIIERASASSGESSEQADLHQRKGREARSRNISDSEQHLILAMLDCLSRAYAVLDMQEECLESAVIVILPFLDNSLFGTSIGAKATEALKKISEINRDVLLRPLLVLAGEELLPFPPSVGMVMPQVFSATGTKLFSGMPLMAMKASNLLHYIHKLPEQNIS